MKNYIVENGHAIVPIECNYGDYSLKEWVSTQRKEKNNLRHEKVKLLEALPFWSWDPFEDNWYEGFNCLKKYVAEYGHVKISQKLKYKGFNLGTWVSHRRKNKNKLSAEKIKLLESLPQWSWSVFEDQWNEGFCYLKKYIDENGHARVPHRFKCGDFNLGTWVGSQKANSKKGKLDLKRIKLLESLPQWSWG